MLCDISQSKDALRIATTFRCMELERGVNENIPCRRANGVGM